MPFSGPPRVLGLGRGPVRVAVPVADVHVRRPALPARRAVAQVQVGQVQPAQLADPEPAVSQPGHHQPVPGRAHRLQQLLPGAVGRQLRMPAPLPRRGQRVGRQLALHMAQERPLPVGPRRQPGQLQLRAQLRVDAQQRLLQVEPLHARRSRRQRALAERAPPGPPRLAIRPAPRRAQRRHVALQVLQRHPPGPAPPAPASAGDPAAGRHTSAGSPTPHSPAGTGPPPHARPRPATRS